MAEEEAETAAAAAMGPFESMFKAAALAGNLCLGLGAVTKVWCRNGSNIMFRLDLLSILSGGFVQANAFGRAHTHTAWLRLTAAINTKWFSRNRSSFCPGWLFTGPSWLPVGRRA